MKGRMSNPGGLQFLPPPTPVGLSNRDKLISGWYGHEIAVLGEAYLKDIPARIFDKAGPWILE